VITTIGVGTSKFLGVRRIFARISPNLPEKFVCDFCLQIFSHKDHEDLFWYDLQKIKKVFMCFCFSAKVTHHFFKSNNAGRHFFPDFQGFCPCFQGFGQIFRDFRQFKTLGGVLAHPASLPPTPLVTTFSKRVY